MSLFFLNSSLLPRSYSSICWVLGLRTGWRAETSCPAGAYTGSSATASCDDRCIDCPAGIRLLLCTSPPGFLSNMSCHVIKLSSSSLSLHLLLVHRCELLPYFSYSALVSLSLSVSFLSPSPSRMVPATLAWRVMPIQASTATRAAGRSLRPCVRRALRGDTAMRARGRPLCPCASSVLPPRRTAIQGPRASLHALPVLAGEATTWR